MRLFPHDVAHSYIAMWTAAQVLAFSPFFALAVHYLGVMLHMKLRIISFGILVLGTFLLTAVPVPVGCLG